MCSASINSFSRERDVLCPEIDIDIFFIIYLPGSPDISWIRVPRAAEIPGMTLNDTLPI
jgi:hypothetical protein